LENDISFGCFFTGLKGERVKFSLIFWIIIIRNVALPVLGVATVKGAVHFGFIHHDPLYEFVLLLQFALPPAVAISKFFMKLNEHLLLFSRIFFNGVFENKDYI